MRNIHSPKEFYRYKHVTENTNKNNNHGGVNSNDKELKGISMGGKIIYDATKDSNRMIIFKCALVTLLCIGCIVLPVMAEFGPFGTLLSLFGGIALSILVIKNV